MYRVCIFAFCFIITGSIISGCNNSHRTKDIFSCTIEESAHAERVRELGADVIEPSDLELLGNSYLSDEIFSLDLGQSVQIGRILSAQDSSVSVGETHYSRGAEGDLRTLGRDEQFTIEVIADLTYIADHSDIIDNGQIELDIRPSGDGARIKFLRKTSYGWETVMSQVLPMHMFLGPHTFAGRYADAEMQVFIDGVMVASKYSPARTRDWAHELEVGQTGVQGRIGRITLGPADMDLNMNFDSLMFGDEFVRGDANQDGQVDRFDVVHIQNTIRGREVACGCEEAYDVNDDGVLDVQDFLAISDIVYGDGFMLAPFPASDMDYDGDDLTCFQHAMN